MNNSDCDQVIPGNARRIRKNPWKFHSEITQKGRRQIIGLAPAYAKNSSERIQFQTHLCFLSVVQDWAGWRTPFLLQQTPLAASLRSCNFRLLYTTERVTSYDTSDIESDWQMLRQSSARYAPILNKPKERRVCEKWGRKERDVHNIAVKLPMHMF